MTVGETEHGGGVSGLQRLIERVPENHTTEAAALEWSLERWTETFPKLAPRQQQQQHQYSAKSKEEEESSYCSGSGYVE